MHYCVFIWGYFSWRECRANKMLWYPHTGLPCPGKVCTWGSAPPKGSVDLAKLCSIHMLAAHSRISEVLLCVGKAAPPGERAELVGCWEAGTQSSRAHTPFWRETIKATGQAGLPRWSEWGVAECLKSYSTQRRNRISKVWLCMETVNLVLHWTSMKRNPVQTLLLPHTVKATCRGCTFQPHPD